MSAVAGAAFLLALVVAIAGWGAVASLVVAARDGYRRVPDRHRDEAAG